MGWLAGRAGSLPVLTGLMAAAVACNTLVGVAMDLPLLAAAAANHTAAVAGNYTHSSVGPPRPNSAAAAAAAAEHPAGWAVLMVVGFAGFGLTDLPTQSLLRAAYSEVHGQKPNGATLMNAAYANMMFKIIFSTTAAFLYGPSAPPWVEVGILHFLAASTVVGQVVLRCRRVEGIVGCNDGKGRGVRQGGGGTSCREETVEANGGRAAPVVAAPGTSEQEMVLAGGLARV